MPAAYTAKTPPNLKLEEAGAIALPLLTAFDALERLKVRKGATILVHGAAGGVGFCAVQLARHLGLRVIATASAKDTAQLNAVGVDRVIDYKSEDFAVVLKPGDVQFIFDVLGGEILLKSLALKPEAVVSVKYIDTSRLEATGMKVRSLLKPLLKLAALKFERAARKHAVRLIGQITAADGAQLARAAEFVAAHGFTLPKYQSLTLAQTAATGLSAGDVGKVLNFS